MNAKSLNGVAYNNTVYAVENSSMTLEDAPPAPSDGWTVENNIFDASANTQVNIRDGRRVPVSIHDGVTQWNDRNNLLRPFGAGASGIAVVNRRDEGVGTLLTLSEWQSMGYGAGSKDGDPLFADPEAGDFALLGKSPAIASGVNVGELLDVDGLAVRDPPSMGALEVERPGSAPPPGKPGRPRLSTPLPSP